MTQSMRMSSAQRAYSALLGNSTAVACILLAKNWTSDRLTCSHCSGSEPSERVASDRDGDVSGNSGSSRRKRARSGPVNPCEEFNTLKWRLSYASRRDDCNAVPSCVFIGRSITGACAPRDPSLVQEQEEKQTASRALPNVPLVLKDRSPEGGKVSDMLRRQDTARRVKESMSKLNTEFAEDDRVLTATRIAEVMDGLDIEQSTQDLALAILKEDGRQAVREFIKSQLATAAAEELRFQETATHNFAKEFLIQVLRNDDLPGKMGQVLESIFRDPDISTGTRHLIYTAVGLEQTFRNSLWLTRDQVTWLLTGTDWMDDEAAKLCAYLVQMDHTVKATIPLVAWSIRQPDILEPPAARALASSLPYGSEKLEESMIWAATRTLESEWALDLAKTTLKAILVPPKPEADAAKSAPRKSPRSGVDSAGDGADGADGADAAASPVDGDAETEPDSKGDAGTVEQASTDGSDDAPADGEMGPQKSA